MIFVLSAGANCRRVSQSVAGVFITSGQSTGNMTWSAPISARQQCSAGSEKLPLVVIQKRSQKVSRKATDLPPGRLSEWSRRYSMNGTPSPRWPSMIFSAGYLSNTPDSTIRTAWVPVWTAKPQAGPVSVGKSAR